MAEILDETNQQEEQVIQPEVVPNPGITGKYKAPFNSKIGYSTIDLSIEENEEAMLKEYNEAFRHGNKRAFGIFPYTPEDAKPQRNALLNNWHLKYHGMPYDQVKALEDEQFRKEGGFYPGANNLHKSMQNNFEVLSLPGLGILDFISDAGSTLIPALKGVDDRWDESTRHDSEVYNGLRKMFSIVIPSLYTTNLTASGLSKLPASMPYWSKAVVGTGAFGLQESAIIGLSEVGDEQTLLGTVAEIFPDVFGDDGRVPLPDYLVIRDSDSPTVRRRKNMLETAGLSVFGTALGLFMALKGNKKFVQWMFPLDDAAQRYKQLELFELTQSADPDKLIRLRKIEEILSTKKLSRQNEQILINEKLNIENELGMIDDFEGMIKRDLEARQLETNAARARRSVDADPNANQLDLFKDEFDPDLYPGIIDESGEARQTIPPANVARNMADTTAIKSGNSVGDPAPIISEAMLAKGLMAGQTSRGAVMGVAQEAGEIGRFDALVDGFRYTNKQMNAAAWDIYTSIVDPGASLDDVKALFYDNKDVTNLLMGRFRVEHLNEEQARAAAFAMRDLVDRFLGRDVTVSSARVMDTLGREASTMANTIKEMAPYVDENRAMNLIIDKMQFLLDEYGLNKYISGWKLRNKNWFDQVPPKELDTVIEQLTKEFIDAENAIHAKNIRFTNTLKELKKSNPAAMRPLVDAFAHTNGDVDTLAKLYKFAADQITPLGLIKSPDPKQMNLFAQGMWSVRYNNVLSGLSALRAMVGNTYQITMKPLTAILGHGISGNIDGVRRSIYYSSAMFETNRRALTDAFRMMKKVHKNPDEMVKAYRKDFVFKSSKAWSIMDDMEKVYQNEGNWGRLAQLNIARGLRDLGNHKALRYGLTGLTFPDAFTATHLATYLSRARAYDDVISEFGYFKVDAIRQAENLHYKSLFDENGLPKDQVLKAITGEVNLNIDDGLANWINQGTTAYPILKDLMMFPRTSSNWIKNSVSWTPLSLIPGMNKYSKTIWAETDEEIAEALFEHGINMANTPNARAIFENLQAEYKGRVAFSGMLVGTLHQYAMAGNIRGNGHYNASRRKKERDQMGYEPKTIKIGNKWVSYEGLIGVEQVLSIIGDIAYYRGDLDEALLENWHAKLAWTVSATFLNDTPLQGIEPLLEALNGDLSAWNRLIANSARSYLPLSGGAGVAANAIDSAQKDIDSNIVDYIKNRLPFFKGTLNDQIDIWTGNAINDIHNPVLKALNALNPLGVSEPVEPWRQWLLSTGWDGISMIKVHSSGAYEYSNDERKLIYEFIGDQQIYKKLEKLMKNKAYAEDLKIIQAHRATGQDRDSNLKIELSKLPLYKEINRIVRTAQKNAENRLTMLARTEPDKYGHIPNSIMLQKGIDAALSAGKPEAAIKLQKQDIDTRKLLSMPK